MHVVRRADTRPELEQIAARLRHPDARIRYQAVRQLARLGDRRALRDLATVYEQDADPRVRAAAAEAGRALRRRSPPGESARATTRRARRRRAWALIAVLGCLAVLFAGVGAALALRAGAGHDLTTARAAAIDRAFAHLERLQSAARPALDLWLAVRRGDEVSCAEPVPELPGPYTLDAMAERFAELTAPVVQLNQGREALARAFAVWEAECRSPRYWIPDDVRDAGYTAAQEAARRLDDAARMLTALRGDGGL